MLSSAKLIPEMDRGKLFIISGPAGSGKTTLIDLLHKQFPTVIKNVSYTTRVKRNDEVDGVDYFFVSQEEFAKREQEGEFLESVALFGNRYGSSRIWVEEQLQKKNHVFLVIDTKGAANLRGSLDAVSIFLKPPSIEVLKERLLLRETEGEEELEERLSRSLYEIEQSKYYDYELINDSLEVAFEVLKSIFISELHKVKNK